MIKAAATSPATLPRAASGAHVAPPARRGVRAVAIALTAVEAVVAAGIGGYAGAAASGGS